MLCHVFQRKVELSRPNELGSCKSCWNVKTCPTKSGKMCSGFQSVLLFGLYFLRKCLRLYCNSVKIYIYTYTHTFGSKFPLQVATFCSLQELCTTVILQRPQSYAHYMELDVYRILSPETEMNSLCKFLIHLLKTTIITTKDSKSK
jgi:hypothetical protein